MSLSHQYRAWESFLGKLRLGISREAAAKDCSITEELFREILADKARNRTDYETARLDGARAAWTQENLEDVMDAIISGEQKGSLKKILQKKRLDYPSFMRVVERDAYAKAMYAEARKLQAAGMLDDLIEIAGESKSSVAASQVNSLKWIMERMNAEFDKATKQQEKGADDEELVEQLEEARHRIEILRQQRLGRSVSVAGGESVEASQLESALG